MHSRQQFPGIEWLAQIVIGSDFQADNAIYIFAFGRQHDDGRLVIGRAQASANREPIFTRQHQVEHDQINRLPLQDAIECLAVLCNHHLKAFLAQVTAQQVTNAGIIINNDNFIRTYRIGLVHHTISNLICNMGNIRRHFPSMLLFYGPPFIMLHLLRPSFVRAQDGSCILATICKTGNTDRRVDDGRAFLWRC